MKRLIVVILLLVFFVLGTAVWWNNGLSAENPNNKTSTIFTVGQGEGVREIANHLKSENLIKDPVVFFLYTRINGIDKQIEAGDFRLSPSMNAQEIASTLTHGTLDIWVTVPEGLRAEEIAQILKQKMPNYNDSWRVALDANEGYLFPDTYSFPKEADANTVISIMKNNFDKKYDSVKGTQTTNLSESQTIIVASIIEREATFPSDRPMVASVIMNRLNLGMPLQIDPTVQYALGYQNATNTWWKKTLTADDLKINSPYNTYLNSGLPPTPISNPGLSAIQAALNPAKTDYLYYYSDSKGHLHFATTLQGHEANIQKYGAQ